MQNLIDEGPYEKIQSYKLEDANKAVKRVVKNLTKLTVLANDPAVLKMKELGFQKKKLMNTNYSIPKLHGLPKSISMDH
jgi:hypothetical protein